MNNFKPLFIEGTEKELMSFVSLPENNETLISYRSRTETILKNKDKVNRILDFIRNNNISDDEMRVFNKILGDKQILDKLVFVWDGSYRSHRIFYKKHSKGDKNSFSIECDWLYYNKRNKYNSMTLIDKLNFLKNNYEIIFIHLVDDEEAINDAMWDSYYDDMIDYYGDYGETQ